MTGRSGSSAVTRLSIHLVLFPLRISSQRENRGDVNQPVADGVGDGGIRYERVPVADLVLGGDDERTKLAAVFDDLQQVGQVVGGGRGHQEVIQDEHAGELQALQRFEELPGAAGGVEFFKERFVADFFNK